MQTASTRIIRIERINADFPDARFGLPFHQRTLRDNETAPGETLSRTVSGKSVLSAKSVLKQFASLF